MQLESLPNAHDWGSAPIASMTSGKEALRHFRLKEFKGGDGRKASTAHRPLGVHSYSKCPERPRTNPWQQKQWNGELCFTVPFPMV